MAVVLLEDAKAFLDIKSNTQDVELSRYLLTAERVVEGRVGPLAPISVTDTYYAPHGVVVLRKRPVVAVDSVSAAGVDDAASWLLDPDAGLLRHVGYVPLPNVLTVTYTAGYAVLPPELETAVLFVLAQIWESQRGPAPSQGHPLFGSNSTEVAPYPGGGAGSLIPPRALEAMYPYLLPTGVG